MKKRGFTLIELLAVIVILAIIALIAMPMVLNTIEDAKKGAASSSAYSYVSEVETKLTSYMLNNSGTSYSKGLHSVSELKTELEVALKGEEPIDGNVCIGDDGTVIEASIKVNGYVINYNGKEAVATDSENVENIACLPTYFTFGTPTTSSSTDYTSLKDQKVFATLYANEAMQGICIIEEKLLCFKTNDYTNTVASLTSNFGKSCTEHDNYISCTTTNFEIYANVDGSLAFTNLGNGAKCSTNSDKVVNCYISE